MVADGGGLQASPGWIRFPTSRPRPSAKVDITMKYSSAKPPTLPTWEALRTDPMPSTIVQKMIGPIIILIRSTNAVPMTANPVASLAEDQPDRGAGDHRDDDRDVQPVGADLLPLGRVASVVRVSGDTGGFVVVIDSPWTGSAGGVPPGWWGRIAR